MSDFTLEVSKRETKGKNANRQLRASGKVPAVVYGRGKPPVAIEVEQRSFDELLRKSNDNPVFLLKMVGTDQSRHTMIRELQRNPVTGKLIHVDFQRVDLDEKVRVDVAIEIHGEAFGVKTEGGLLDFITREVEVLCLPNKIPAKIDVDVTEFHVGQHLEAGQLELPDDVELHVEPSRVILSISGKMMAEEDDVEDDGMIEKVSAEPEVIGRKADE